MGISQLVLRCVVDRAEVKKAQEHHAILHSSGVRLVRLTRNEAAYDLPAEKLDSFQRAYPDFIIESAFHGAMREEVKMRDTEYSFCESITGIGPWHIRILSDAGKKLGGGIDTPTLCGFVAPIGVETQRGLKGGGGWDLEVPITEHHLSHTCVNCVAVYRQQVKQAAPYPGLEVPVKNKSKLARFMDRVLPARRRKAVKS